MTTQAEVLKLVRVTEDPNASEQEKTEARNALRGVTADFKRARETRIGRHRPLLNTR